MIPKFKYFIFLICFTLSFTVLSQNLKIGIEGGASYTNLRGNSIAEKSESLFSHLIGVYGEFPISEQVFLKGGLNYERKGSKIDSRIDDYNGIPLESYTINNSYNYLTLPILIKYQFNGQVKFFINGGPYVGYLLNSKSKTKSTNDYDTSYLYKKIDFGLVAGVGMLIPFNDNFQFSLEIRDNLGVINISKVDVVGSGTIKTNSLNFLLGVNLDIL